MFIADINDLPPLSHHVLKPKKQPSNLFRFQSVAKWDNNSIEQMRHQMEKQLQVMTANGNIYNFLHITLCVIGCVWDYYIEVHNDTYQIAQL